MVDRINRALRPTFASDSTLFQKHRELKREFLALKSRTSGRIDRRLASLKRIYEKLQDLDEQVTTHWVRYTGQTFWKILAYSIGLAIALIALLYSVAALSLIAPMPLAIIPLTIGAAISLSVVAFVVLRKYHMIVAKRFTIIGSGASLLVFVGVNMWIYYFIIEPQTASGIFTLSSTLIPIILSSVGLVATQAVFSWLSTRYDTESENY